VQNMSKTEIKLPGQSGTLRLTVLGAPATASAATAASEEVLGVALLRRRVAGRRRQPQRHVEPAEALPGSRGDVDIASRRHRRCFKLARSSSNGRNAGDRCSESYGVHASGEHRLTLLLQHMA